MDAFSTAFRNCDIIVCDSLCVNYQVFCRKSKEYFEFEDLFVAVEISVLWERNNAQI